MLADVKVESREDAGIGGGRERGLVEAVLDDPARLRVPVEADAVEARLEAGILQLSLPKAPQARPRSIPVKVA